MVLGRGASAHWKVCGCEHIAPLLELDAAMQAQQAAINWAQRNKLYFAETIMRRDPLATIRPQGAKREQQLEALQAAAGQLGCSVGEYVEAAVLSAGLASELGCPPATP